MGEMADLANDYQDSTMDEYYGYFDGSVDIPYGEQIPELCKEFELPSSLLLLNLTPRKDEGLLRYS